MIFEVNYTEKKNGNEIYHTAWFSGSSDVCCEQLRLFFKDKSKIVYSVNVKHETILVEMK